MELCDLSIKQAHEGLILKKFTSKELTLSCLKRIEQLEDDVNAFITVTAEKALASAKKTDKLFSRNEIKSPLQGIPCSIKDVFVTKGVTTTCGSKILENFIPPYSGTAVKKLEESGCVFLGKTNMDEFGQGSSTENSAFGPTKNPWDKTRVPGGSSGGSAAAVTSGMGIFSLAEDTGGSIRQPASFCNVTGLKPTYGRVSRYGVIAYGSSLDTQGPIARSVEDSAIILSCIAGHDPLDSTSSKNKVPDYTKLLNRTIKGLKIGLPKEYFSEGIDKEVKRVVLKATDVFKSLGCSIHQMSLPNTKYAVATYYITVKSEVSSNLARYDGIRYGLSEKVAKTLQTYYLKTREKGFGDEVKRGIMFGTYSLSAGYFDQYYKKAQKVRTVIRKELEDAFKEYDILLTPVSPFPPFKLGEKLADPLQMYLADVYMSAINLSGIPSLAIPAGFSNDGLPIGMQILGTQFSEDKLIQVGSAFQKATDWHKKRPKL